MTDELERFYAFPGSKGKLHPEPQWTFDEKVLFKQAEVARSVLVGLGMAESEAQKRYEHDMGHCQADVARRGRGVAAAFGNSIRVDKDGIAVEATIVYCTPRGTRTKKERVEITRGGMKVHGELTSQADKDHLYSVKRR